MLTGLMKSFLFLASIFSASVGASTPNSASLTTNQRSVLFYVNQSERVFTCPLWSVQQESCPTVTSPRPRVSASVSGKDLPPEHQSLAHQHLTTTNQKWVFQCINQWESRITDLAPTWSWSPHRDQHREYPHMDRSWVSWHSWRPDGPIRDQYCL